VKDEFLRQLRMDADVEADPNNIDAIINEDFDSGKFDELMAKIFNNDYYSKSETNRPVWSHTDERPHKKRKNNFSKFGNFKTQPKPNKWT